MKDYDVCSLGAAKVAATTGIPLAQCVAPVSDTEQDAESYGELPVICALGVAALPAAPDPDGTSAEGVVLRSVGGLDGAVVAGHDPRAGAIYGQLSPGETALHSTGKDFGVAFLAKDGEAAIYVKAKPGSAQKDVIHKLDQNTEQVTTSAFGHLVTMSADNGIVLAAKGGQAWISIKDDTITICAPKVMLGATPAALTGVAIGPQPGANSTSVFAST